ncbi:MAG: hypothetical protein P1P77_00205 [Spirochaetaceae bacterium]|nr:hypothetical protein [Spirochaetaceae bacterium]
MTSRRKRTDYLGRYVSAGPRFAAGMAMLPPYLMLGELVPKGLLVLLFAVLAVLAGKKMRWGYFIILVLSVTFFHLLAPWGRVLMTIGPLPITLGALENGLIRGFTLVGMVFLSVAAVRPELELPGRLGGLLGRTFYHFDAVLEGRRRLSRKDFFGSLDELLLERFDPRLADFGDGRREDETSAETSTETSTEDSPSNRTGRGWPWAVPTALIPWALWAWTLLKNPWS